MRPRTSWVTLAWPTMSWATIAAILLATLSVVVTPALSTADRAAFRHPRHLLHLRALVALRPSRGYRGHSRPARRCPGALDVVADQFSRRRSNPSSRRAVPAWYTIAVRTTSGTAAESLGYACVQPRTRPTSWSRRIWLTRFEFYPARKGSVQTNSAANYR